jgi:hypothetical protein
MERKDLLEKNSRANEFTEAEQRAGYFSPFEKVTLPGLNESIVPDKGDRSPPMLCNGSVTGLRAALEAFRPVALVEIKSMETRPVLPGHCLFQENQWCNRILPVRAV